MHSPQGTLESYSAAVEGLLRQIVLQSGLNLNFQLRKETQGSGAGAETHYSFDFSGPDQDLLLEKNAALLDALETVTLKAVRMEETLLGRISFDCQDWRRLRVEELKLMAQVAAERVIESGDPFTLSPMTARERRIVHLALKDQTGVRTQSEGFGAERRVVIIKR